MTKKANKMTQVVLTTGMMKQKPGDVVNVRTGYAKNKLIPSGLAIRLRGNEHIIKAKMEEWKRRDEEQQQIAERYKEKLEGISIEIKAESGVGNTLYGAINSARISHILKDSYNINIPKNDIIMDPIKLLGQYKVKLNLYGNHAVDLEVSVVPIG